MRSIRKKIVCPNGFWGGARGPGDGKKGERRGRRGRGRKRKEETTTVFRFSFARCTFAVRKTPFRLFSSLSFCLCPCRLYVVCLYLSLSLSLSISLTNSRFDYINMTKHLRFCVTDLSIDICLDFAVLLERSRRQHPEEQGGLQKREDV